VATLIRIYLSMRELMLHSRNACLRLEEYRSRAEEISGLPKS
jgi:hypothetical protein